MTKKLYSILVSHFPDWLHRLIVNALLTVNAKPTVNPGTNKFIEGKGTLIFSADLELAWASRFSKSKKDFLAIAKRERENIPKILNLSEKFQIPVTWATVGHLFLSECKRHNGVAHSEMQKPEHFENSKWKFIEGDWYQHDPSTNVEVAPLWYAPDIIREILKSNSKHEIACHSFSHIDFSAVKEEVATSELERSIALAKEFNLHLQSMVFPGGFLGHFDIIKNKGFLCYRKSLDYDIDLPVLEKSGLVALPHSYMIGKPMFFRKPNICKNLLKKYLWRAIETQKIVHLSFHPSMNVWYIDNILSWLFAYVAELKNSEKLEVLTMKQAAKIFLANEATTI